MILRLLLYISVAAITFFLGISSFIGSILLEWKLAAWTSNNVKISKKSNKSSNNLPLPQKLYKSVKIECQNKNISAVWKKLKDEEFFSKQITAWQNDSEKVLDLRHKLGIEKEKIRENLTEIIFDCTNFLRVKEIDLNYDGKQEIIVTPRIIDLGSNFEYRIKVFEVRDEEAFLLLQENKVTYITLGKNNSNSFQELQIWSIKKMHQHGCESEMYLAKYGFDGKIYKRTSLKYDGDLLTVSEKTYQEHLFRE